jgi:hypothetical protein
MSIEERIREGQIMIEDSSVHMNNMYRGVFIDGNFYLYKYIQRSIRWKDDIFGDDILMLVYSNVVRPQQEIPPSVIHVRMHDECNEELRCQI